MEPGLGDRVTLERTGEHVTRLGVANSPPLPAPSSTWRCWSSCDLTQSGRCCDSRGSESFGFFPNGKKVSPLFRVCCPGWNTVLIGWER